MKKLINDKGAAMVSVLVAVTFIAILSSSLLYMAYMNYLTKAMRLSAADTFYTDEYALDDLASSLQQVISRNPKKEDALSAVEARCGVVDTGSYKYYTGSKVAENIKYATKDPKIESIVVDTVYDTSVSGNYAVKGNSIVLSGLEITTTTIEGYTSTIVTDLIITFPNSGSGDMDVNSFSIIADNVFHAQEGILTLTGNIFCKHPQCNNQDENYKGHAALVVDGAAVVTMLSPRGLIYGDIEINGTGVMSIAGNVAVTGNLNLDDNSVLFVSGQLVVNGAWNGKGKIIGDDNITYKSGTMDLSQLPDSSDPTSSTYSKGMYSSLLCDVRLYNTVTNHFDTITPDDFFSKCPGGETPKITSDMPSKAHPYIGDDSTGLPTIPTTPIGPNPDSLDPWPNNYFGGCIRKASTVDNGKTWSCIMFSMSAFDIQGNGDIIESTILTTDQVDARIDAVSTHMSFMPDDGYEIAKETLVSYSTTLHELGNYKKEMASGGKTEFEEAIADASHVEEYYDNKSAGSLYTEKRYAVFDGTYNYIPFGYFIRADSSSYISTIMNSVLGDIDTTNTSATYKNWYKE